MNILTAINWKSGSARAVAVVFVGSILGVLWILSDLVSSQRVIGWIVLGILGLPLYVIAESLGDKVLSSNAREQSSRSLSWKRVWFGLAFFLGIFLVASCLHFLIH